MVTGGFPAFCGASHETLYGLSFDIDLVLLLPVIHIDFIIGLFGHSYVIYDVRNLS